MKNELGLFEKKNKVLVSSRDVAEKFNKHHFSIVNTIDGIIKDSEGYQFRIDTPIFQKQSFLNEQNGQEYVEYLLNKRAFVLLMMRLKGEIVFDMQNKYIDHFEEMESLIRERATTEWLETRKKGKLVRRQETDAIQQLIPYAITQGSKNATKLYMTYSKLVNATVGIESGMRDKIPFKQLMQITMLEDMITSTIFEKMSTNVYYKEIYKICKAKSEQFASLMLLGNKK